MSGSPSILVLSKSHHPFLRALWNVVQMHLGLARTLLPGICSCCGTSVDSLQRGISSAFQCIVWQVYYEIFFLFSWVSKLLLPWRIQGNVFVCMVCLGIPEFKHWRYCACSWILPVVPSGGAGPHWVSRIMQWPWLGNWAINQQRLMQW